MAVFLARNSLSRPVQASSSHAWTMHMRRLTYAAWNVGTSSHLIYRYLRSYGYLYDTRRFIMFKTLYLFRKRYEMFYERCNSRFRLRWPLIYLWIAVEKQSDTQNIPECINVRLKHSFTLLSLPSPFYWNGKPTRSEVGSDAATAIMTHSHTFWTSKM